MIQATPQIVNDVDQNWGNDLVLSSTGDLQTVNGSNMGQQRILRRLLTNPGNYIWHTTYGAGIPALIGQAITLDLYDKITSLINSNIFLESSVSQSPLPVILLQTIQAGLFCQINYTDSPSKNPVVLTFNVGV